MINGTVKVWYIYRTQHTVYLKDVYIVQGHVQHKIYNTINHVT